MRNVKLALLGLAALGGIALQTGSASALPLGGLAGAAPAAAQPARWVCGPFRCWWQPHYYPAYRVYGYGWGPRFYGRPYLGPRVYARPF